MKYCRKCSQYKDHSEFRKDKDKKDGLNTVCKSCKNAYDRNYDKDVLKNRETQKRYYYKHRDKLLEKYAKYREEHREECRERVSRWSKEHKSQRAAKEAERRCRKLNATPSWADLELIELIYDSCEPGYHVDHIIPLKGKTVCGLHTHENLQYLPAIENIRKSNILGGY